MAEAETPGETPEEKRERVMRRLAEILRAAPPDLSASESGPVTTGAFPALPSEADEFDQEAAAELFSVLSEFFNQRRREAGPEGSERE